MLVLSSAASTSSIIKNGELPQSQKNPPITILICQQINERNLNWACFLVHFKFIDSRMGGVDSEEERKRRQSLLAAG